MESKRDLGPEQIPKFSGCLKFRGPKRITVEFYESETGQKRNQAVIKPLGYKRLRSIRDNNPEDTLTALAEAIESWDFKTQQGEILTITPEHIGELDGRDIVELIRAMNKMNEVEPVAEKNFEQPSPSQ